MSPLKLNHTHIIGPKVLMPPLNLSHIYVIARHGASCIRADLLSEKLLEFMMAMRFCSYDLCSHCLLSNISGALFVHVLPSFNSSCTSLAMPCQCKTVDFASTSLKYEFTMENYETRPVHIIGSCVLFFCLDHATSQVPLILGCSENACSGTRNSCRTSTTCINGIGGS